MNKHIELVKKWLADKDAVSLEELEANSNAAYHADATDSAYDATDSAYYAAAAEAAYAAYRAADYADYAAYRAADYADYAAYWVEKYEELTK